MNTDMQKTNGNGAATAADDGNPHAGTEAAARIAHDFVDRVAKIAGQSEEKLRNVSANAETSVKHSLETAKHSLETARGKIGETRTALSAKSGEVQTSVTGFVKEHPFAALGIAFGTGVLLSYLTRGSRRIEPNDDNV